MMDSFLRGMGKEFDQLQKQWDNTPPHTERSMGFDVGEELKDLLRVYTDAKTHLESKERLSMDHLIKAMESFLSAYKEKNKVAFKLHALQNKLSAAPECDCDGDEDDE